MQDFTDLHSYSSIQHSTEWGVLDSSIEEIIHIICIMSKLFKSQLYSYSWYCYNHLIITLDKFIENSEKNTKYGHYEDEGLTNMSEKRKNLAKQLNEFDNLSEKVQHLRFQDARQSHWGGNKFSKHLHWLGEMAETKNQNKDWIKANYIGCLSWSERLLNRMEKSIMVVPDVNQCVGHAFAFAFLQQVVVEPSVQYESKLQNLLERIKNTYTVETKFGQAVGYKFQIFQKSSDNKEKLNSLKAIRRLLPTIGEYIIKLTRLQRMGTIWCNSILSISVGNTRKFLNGLLPLINNLINSLSNKLFALGQFTELKEGNEILSIFGEYVKGKIIHSNFLNIFGDLYELLNASWRIVTITSILVPSSKAELSNIVEHKYGTTLEALRRDILNRKNESHVFEWPSNLNQETSNYFNGEKNSLLISLFDTLDEYWNACATLHPLLHKLCMVAGRIRTIMILLNLPIASPITWKRFIPINGLSGTNSDTLSFTYATRAIIEGTLGYPSNSSIEWDFVNYQQSRLCGIDAASSLITGDLNKTVDKIYIESNESNNKHLIIHSNIPLCGVCALPVSTESTVNTHYFDLDEFRYASKSTLVRGRWYHQTCLELLNSESERECHSLFVLPQINIPQII
ncbi:uncharacterized protein cubi_03027 [Cryptosporidium ubiquitum]|uniref:Uncharacterized protein n=1 Tax=Cryptosporidium ubiquitum TaxID=857276 RepID=A0A1J4ML04_9CRYT|nr:uncharacterized protein cubi_03027 [Cryptosporidium ubiquitum]OII74896.1 hypothetical protein cubi_03027 [Cryptosporidium ubiquitum]